MSKVRFLYLLSALLTIGLGAGAYWISVKPLTPPTPWLVVDEPSRDLGTVPIGIHSVRYVITNVGTGPCSILGVREHCGLCSCCTAKSREARIVLPGEAVEYECRLRVTDALPFESELTLYVDDGGLRVITLSMKGTGIPAGLPVS
jgi:hypothetical protein